MLTKYACCGTSLPKKGRNKSALPDSAKRYDPCSELETLMMHIAIREHDGAIPGHTRRKLIL